MFHVGFGVFLLDSQIQSCIPLFVVGILVLDLGRFEGRESEERRCFGRNRPLLLRLQPLRGSGSRLQVTLVVALVLLVVLVVVAVLLAEEDGFTCNEVVSSVGLQLMRREAPGLGGLLVVMELRFFRIFLASF